MKRLPNFWNYDDQVVEDLYHWWWNKTISYNIIGVVKNFNFETLRQKMTGSVFLKNNGLFHSSKCGNVTSHIKQIESKWKLLAPGMPLVIVSWTSHLMRHCRTEQRVGKIALIFSVSLSCMSRPFTSPSLRSKDQSWHKESFGSKCSGNRSPAIKRFYETGLPCLYHCCTWRFWQMVTGFCISYINELVGIRHCRHLSTALPLLQSAAIKAA